MHVNCHSMSLLTAVSGYFAQVLRLRRSKKRYTSIYIEAITSDVWLLFFSSLWEQHSRVQCEVDRTFLSSGERQKTCFMLKHYPCSSVKQWSTPRLLAVYKRRVKTADDLARLWSMFMRLKSSCDWSTSFWWESMCRRDGNHLSQPFLYPSG